MNPMILKVADDLPTERHENGAKKRVDGRGDPWANAHRENTAGNCYMQDLDGFFGMLAYGANTGDNLFMEYEIHRSNCGKPVDHFGLVCLFDRKSTFDVVWKLKDSVRARFYYWCCKKLSECQPKPARMFYVVGSNHPPWKMYEANIETGELNTTPIVLDGNDWKKIWNEIGLMSLRQEISQWCRGKNT